MLLLQVRVQGLIVIQLILKLKLVLLLQRYEWWFSYCFQLWKFSNDCAILTVKFHNLDSALVQHVPMEEKAVNNANNRLALGSVVDTSTSVHIQQFVEIEGEFIETFGGTCYEMFEGKYVMKLLNCHHVTLE